MFVVLCIITTIINEKHIVFSSSIFALLLINSLVHIVPIIKQKRYSPGLVSAIFLFIPIGIIGYIDLLNNNLMTIKKLMISILLGVLWMSVPFVFQMIRIIIKKINKSKSFLSF